jgi:hypothetical protein
MIVTVESALTSVRASAERLREAVQELVLIAVEDRPCGPEIHLTTQVHDAALDLDAEAEQATDALRSGGQGTSRAVGGRHVAECQACINAFGAVLVRELAIPGRLNDLATLGHVHGREAGAWADEIVRCIEICQHLLWTDVQPALLGYWEEVIEMDPDTSSESGRVMTRRSKPQ